MTVRDIIMAAAGAEGVPPSPSDPQFNYVTMLLHGDGTNGAQNNTFLDSSSNNFTITGTGAPTQGSFSPYGDLWSNSFNGTNSQISAPANAAWAFGTGNFTVEAWIYISADGSTNSGGNREAVIFRNATTGTVSFQFMLSGNTTTTGTGLQLYSSSGMNVTGSFSFAKNVWYHVAGCRSGSSVRLFVNGTQIGTTATSSTSVGSASYTIEVGGSSYSGYADRLNGAVSNARVIKGTALYTSNFTPSTTPLTAVSGTSLLTCQSSRFKDNSSNNFAITATGTPSVQVFSPFDPATEYSPSLNGGSGVFSGSSQYLQAPSNTALSVLSGGDFTLEAWVYLPATPGTNGAPIIAQTATSTGYLLRVNPSLRVAWVLPAIAEYLFGPTLTLNSWHHIAVCRVSGVVTGYVNGTQYTFTSTNRTTNATTAVTVGGDPNSGSFSAYLNGYISNARIVKGTAVYTANFTPPTAPLTAITNTSLLLNFTNAGIYDDAKMSNLTTVGNAQVSTSVKKYGTGSLAFDGSGDYLTVPNTLPFVFGTGDWTIETWVYFSDVTTSRNIYESRLSTEANRPVLYVASGTIRYYNGSTDVITSSTVSTGQWYHVAVCKASGSTRMFLNGTQTGSTYTDSLNYGVGAGRPLIGTYNASTGFFSGYLDDFRVTKGVARYTANFTPPTEAFPNK